jgi:hypothetical protein
MLACGPAAPGAEWTDRDGAMLGGTPLEVFETAPQARTPISRPTMRARACARIVGQEIGAAVSGTVEHLLDRHSGPGATCQAAILAMMPLGREHEVMAVAWWPLKSPTDRAARYPGGRSPSSDRQVGRPSATHLVRARHRCPHKAPFVVNFPLRPPDARGEPPGTGRALGYAAFNAP